MVSVSVLRDHLMDLLTSSNRVQLSETSSVKVEHMAGWPSSTHNAPVSCTCGCVWFESLSVPAGRCINKDEVKSLLSWTLDVVLLHVTEWLWTADLIMFCSHVFHWDIEGSHNISDSSSLYHLFNKMLQINCFPGSYQLSVLTVDAVCDSHVKENKNIKMSSYLQSPFTI